VFNKINQKVIFKQKMDEERFPLCWSKEIRSCLLPPKINIDKMIKTKQFRALEIDN
jgi:hypothetical protein